MENEHKDQIWYKHWWIAKADSTYLKTKLSETLVLSGFTILGKVSHEFTPFGFAIVFLLAESHLALHTWPEHGKAYVDLSSCNQGMYDAFVIAFETMFEDCIMMPQETNHE